MVNANLKYSDDALKAYDELRLKQKYHYIIFKIQNKVEVVIDQLKVSEEKFDYSEFHKAVSSINEPRFITLDYHYTLEESRKLEKIVFITWSPDKGPVAAKMLYAAAKEDFKKKLQGIHKAHQATDQSELEEGAILALLNAK
jgi:cofilin